MNTKRRTNAEARFPSVLEEAFRDPEFGAIDPVAKLAMSQDYHEYTWALSLLRNMYEFRRDEAGVFLIGLLLTCGNNWEKRIAIVNILSHVQTEACVSLLFDELRRVRNTNSTRRYLSVLVDVLSDMPEQLVDSTFRALAEDKSFSHRMRFVFKQALDGLIDQEPHRQPPSSGRTRSPTVRRD